MCNKSQRQSTEGWTQFSDVFLNIILYYKKTTSKLNIIKITVVAF